MLDEYKTPDIFWTEAINTACHAINRLYLHKYLGKTPYEIITGNKPKVHYFRVFGSKCFILNKKTKSSKFAPKVDEDFLLGYGTNKHAYHVFNKTTSCVEVMVDATFDESDSSRVGKIDKNLVDEEEPLSQSIMRMGLGEVRPHEVEAQASVQENNNDLSLSTRVEPPSSQQPQVQNQVHGIDQGENKVEKLKKMLHKLKIMCMDLFNLNHKFLIQEFIKAFNGIILLTISLEVFKEG
jgi:hypothetical protein